MSPTVMSFLSHSIGPGGPGGASEAQGYSWRGWPVHSTRRTRTGSGGAKLPTVGTQASPGAAWVMCMGSLLTGRRTQQLSTGGYTGKHSTRAGTRWPRVEGCVLRPPSEPSPPCSHINLVSPLAPSLSLQLACLGGRVDGPGVPPAKTQARKSFQKSNKFTKIENNYSRVSSGL